MRSFREIWNKLHYLQQSDGTKPASYISALQWVLDGDKLNTPLNGGLLPQKAYYHGVIAAIRESGHISGIDGITEEMGKDISTHYRKGVDIYECINIIIKQYGQTDRPYTAVQNEAVAGSSEIRIEKEGDEDNTQSQG